MVIKRFTGMLGGKKTQDEASPSVDTPEANATRGVKSFCESGGPNNQSQGEEVLHLPVIVEAAESSPQAAAAAAYQIRKFLSKDNYSRPHVQYNAVMLIRILSDNPGPSFTKNVDAKFVATVKELLRTARDPSVQQIMRETMSSLYLEKAYDGNLAPLFAMWNKENASQPQPHTQSQPRSSVVPSFHPQPSHPYDTERYSRRGGRENGLPAPAELSARIEEAKTSAKLLQQLVQSTPAAELLTNDLIKEFSERCQSAQRSLQGYINCVDPSPDADTLQTLIETSEQLSVATSQHQRAVLGVRRTLASPPPAPSPDNIAAAPSVPPPSHNVPIIGPVPTHRRASKPAPYNMPSPEGPHPATMPFPAPPGPGAGPPSASFFGSGPPPPPPSQSMQTSLGNRTAHAESHTSPSEDPFADSYSHHGRYSPAHSLEYAHEDEEYARRQGSSAEQGMMHGGLSPETPVGETLERREAVSPISPPGHQRNKSETAESLYRY
ncbi:hypothetical protein K402DRAFT_412756 [Aulographum hederae CBS 113979]|uniref:GAT domain-containing protein n=1 Tax=Aulographum hederae CBS 113979 TaxID=1176131 RepID=A0A6G1H007_9PEZI|nr:hypothetical protein K402DRAFT_412756 [Aulographum hederae CBS 113979]